jgi:hypothetical protein
MKKEAKHKAILPNGRTSKPLPKFENWHCRIFPKDITYPAWKDLSKSSTDIANICRAKHDHAAYCGQKNTSSHPVFTFTATEAKEAFGFTRTTFNSSIKQLIDIGFLVVERHGGILDGKGIPTIYRLSDEWKKRNRRPRDTSNILKARAARKPGTHG